MSENNDVDLDEILGSEDGSSSGASTATDLAEANGAKKPTQAVSKDVKPSEMSERENARVRDLTDKVKALEAFISDKFKNSPTAESSSLASDLDKFLEETVSDAGSRQVLKKYGGLLTEQLRKQLSQEFNPKFSEVAEITFEREFSQFASRFPSLNAHKDELLKTFKANPNASLKALIGELILDQAASRVKPVETQRSQVSREKIDTDSLSKDELYDLLEANL